MVVGTGKIKFKLCGVGSLKEKRSIVKSINTGISKTDYFLSPATQNQARAASWQQTRVSNPALYPAGS